MSVQAESKPNSLLEAALLSEAPKQWMRFQKNKGKRSKGKAKWQREIEEIDVKVTDAMANADESRQRIAELIRINANLKRKIGMPTKGLWCPVCGEGDMGNTMNGRPWCIKCNSPLEPAEAENKRLPKVKVLRKTKRLDVTFRGLNE
jgi:hypothetical protein